MMRLHVLEHVLTPGCMTGFSPEAEQIAMQIRAQAFTMQMLMCVRVCTLEVGGAPLTNIELWINSEPSSSHQDVDSMI